MSEAKHQGSCHCGKVKYEVTLDLEQPVIACNCSMCGRSGTMLSFAPTSQFKLLSGEEDLRDYQFNRKSIHHLFCTNCGIKPFARGKMQDGSPMVAINVRCLQGVDVDKLNINKFDGASQ
jgi:hypothetical protein